MIPEDMKPELDSMGANLEDWLSWFGNTKLMVAYSTVFWPNFKLLDDCIVGEQTTQASFDLWRDHLKGDLRGVESVLNHRHLADFHTANKEETTLDRIRFLMPILKEIYDAKLKWQFPDRPCKVVLFYPEDEADLVGHQITFWQQKHEEA